MPCISDSSTVQLDTVLFLNSNSCRPSRQSKVRRLRGSTALDGNHAAHTSKGMVFRDRQQSSGILGTGLSTPISLPELGDGPFHATFGTSFYSVSGFQGLRDTIQQALDACKRACMGCLRCAKHRWPDLVWWLASSPHTRSSGNIPCGSFVKGAKTKLNIAH
jgi:hypothetical protein